MTSQTRTVIVTAFLALSLMACGQKAEPPKKDEPPALPQPKTGDAIDAAAEEAMLAAEESTDAKAEEAEAKASIDDKADVKAEKTDEKTAEKAAEKTEDR